MEGQTLIAISPEYLDRLVLNIRQQVADGFVSLKSHMVEKPLTRREAADFLKIKLSAFQNRINRGDIPAKLIHKNGGTPYFFASELEQFLKKS